MPQITKTTELVTLANDKLKVDFGPDLPMPLFGHCIVAVNDAFVIIGGYLSDNTGIGDETDETFIYDPKIGYWISGSLRPILWNISISSLNNPLM